MCQHDPVHVELSTWSEANAVGSSHSGLAADHGVNFASFNPRNFEPTRNDARPKHYRCRLRS